MSLLSNNLKKLEADRSVIDEALNEIANLTTKIDTDLSAISNEMITVTEEYCYC
jgi:hypothetical protein